MTTNQTSNKFMEYLTRLHPMLLDTALVALFVAVLLLAVLT